MKLRNKKTGEIRGFGYLQSGHIAPLVLTTYENDKPEMHSYNSLAELESDWEDYEEWKPWWYIDITLDVKQGELFLSKHVEQFKTVGNYFEIREEAEKAVDKLKAWKRLKDKGFRFDNLVRDAIYYEISDEEIEKDIVRKDLDLLFGGEE